MEGMDDWCGDAVGNTQQEERVTQIILNFRGYSRHVILFSGRFLLHFRTLFIYMSGRFYLHYVTIVTNKISQSALRFLGEIKGGYV